MGELQFSHVDGMNEAEPCDGQLPYFSRSQAALMRRIASTMFSSLVALAHAEALGLPKSHSSHAATWAVLSK